MMKSIFGSALLSVLAFMAPRSDADGIKVGDVLLEQNFQNSDPAELKKHWTMEGGGWTMTTGPEGILFEIPAGTEKPTLKMGRPLSVELIKGATLQLSARIRGENVSARPAPWNGVKIALQIVTPSQTSTLQVRPAPEGTFDWRDVTTVIAIPESTKSARLIVGLELVTGKLWIENVKIKVLEEPLPSVAAPPKTGPFFTGHPLPRLRGAMVRTAVTEDDLRVLGKDWNANVIRWQLGGLQYKKTGLNTPDFDKILDEEIAQLDRMLPVCKKYGLYVVVDLHSLAMKCFESTANQDKLVEVWKKLAAHYKGNEVIWAYDIVNEPRLDEWKDGSLLWNGLAEKVAKGIREIDPVTPIIIEPEKMALPEGFSSLRPVSVPNVIYSVHMYNPGQFTHNKIYDKKQETFTYPGVIDGKIWDKEALRKNLQPVIDFQKKYGVHIYMGEFSAVRWSPGAAQYFSDIIDICEENGWDWTYHAFREFQGWSVEHGADIADTNPSATPTDRQKVVRAWFDINKKPAWTQEAPKVFERVLFVGDSITMHGPEASLEWAGNWGMAASAKDKDYVHLFLARLAASQGGKMPEFLIAGGGGGKVSDKVAVKQQFTDFHADLAIVQLGENDRENITVEGFQKPYEEILKAIRAGNQDVTIICLGVWSNGWATKDTLIQAACAANQATFADLTAINENPENKAGSESRYANKAVNWHPGDKGMAAYAQAIWTALSAPPVASKP